MLLCESTYLDMHKDIAYKHKHLTAAQAAINYNGGGYSDWYLPSKGELDQMYLILEDLSSTWHWSSTEYSNSHAWNKYNDWSIANKNTHYMVRPIRSF